MIFRRVEPSPDYSALRLLSEGDRWELGLNPYHNGTRLRMGLRGKPPSVLDLCMGDDSKVYSSILIAVLERLESLPESASSKEIDSLFPWAGTRPDLNIHLELLLEKRRGQ